MNNQTDEYYRFAYPSDKYCPSCNTPTRHTADYFCGLCGGRLAPASKIKYLGDSQSQGRYRITLVIEQDFTSDDHVLEEVRHTLFGESQNQFDQKIIELVHLTSNLKTHPYICEKCSIDQFQPLVAETNQGRCHNCGGENWILRHESDPPPRLSPEIKILGKDKIAH